MGLLLSVAGVAAAQEATKPPLPPHDLAGKENCTMCHKVGGEMGGMPASHEGYTKENCLLCHSEGSPMQSGSPPAIPHGLEGKENCTMCHQSGVMNAPKEPDSHADFKADQCTICHQKKTE
jgi:hypothetical protein